jgi:mannose-6-phosphate isomerase
LNHREHIILFPQNRVWRTYPGGRVLDILAGKTEPEDTHFPEDWIGSVTRAKNPGRENIEEGVSTVAVGGKQLGFDELLASDPEYFLGADHLKGFGPHPRLLVKLLDSAIRLHFQCHPTAAFAQSRMDEPSGKAEAYHILAIREEVENPYVYIGFQRTPEKADLKRWIESQDIAAIESCFDRIPVKPGDTLFIPGGYPHAIGEGILMVEIMEPSDLAVRFEFEKAGYVLPEEARFMGRGLDFCLEVFDFTENSMERIREKTFFQPQKIRDYPEGGSQYHLIGEETTPCMQVRQSVFTGTVEKREDQCFIGIVTKGRVRLSNGMESKVISSFDKFFFPAKASDIKMEALDGEATILECYPPRAPEA